MRNRNIHPAVFVVIEHRNTGCRREFFRIVQGLRGIFAFARIHIDQRRSPIPSDRNVHRAVIIEVRQDRRLRLPVPAQTRRFRPFGKRLVPIIPPQNIRRTGLFQWRASQKQIQIAIVVIIHKRNSCRPILCLQASFCSHILELALAQIAKQQHLVAQRDGEIVQSIAIEIAYRAGDSMA